jgi:CRISPR-associated protein Cmx8
LAKTKTKIKEAIEVLTLHYRIAELPSSQHRAGLAGLVLVRQWLEKQDKFQEKLQAGATCQLSFPDEYSAILEIDRAGIAALFDEIYDANTEEQARDKPFKNKQTKEIIPPLREEEIEEEVKGKTKTKKLYVYPIDIPQGSFLVDPSYDPTSDGKNGLWIKLWRDMVWSILRGVPATRKPFEARAKGTNYGDSDEVWQQLCQPSDFTVELPSTYFLGAQACNAENIAFKDRARFQFLLHFWVFAAQIYVPAVIDNEGKPNFVGYAIAIPDVANLKVFCGKIQKVLQSRSDVKSGYRPRDAIIDLAVESALDLMHRMRDRLSQIEGERSTRRFVFGIDVIHAEKQGNNVRLLGINRLDPDDAMDDEYSRIRESFWSPLFRRQRLLNLVNHSPWYEGFGKLLCTLPYEQTIENGYFRRDVRLNFESIQDRESNMSDSEEKKSIETIIFQLIKNYVGRKLKLKYDLEWKSEWKGLKQEELDKKQDYLEYSKTKRKVAKSAFLDVRSRTEQTDFINYFVSSLCSVPQHMKSEDYAMLAQKLYRDTDEIRTLTLLALSANS